MSVPEKKHHAAKTASRKKRRPSSSASGKKRRPSAQLQEKKRQAHIWPADTHSKRKQRRSVAQANLASRKFGPIGDYLMEALHVPGEGAGADSLTHGFHAYPGRFHPKLVRMVLEQVDTGKSQHLLDPFMGGGTTLVEGMCKGFEVHGNDLNPIALMVAKERCRLRSEKGAAQVRNTLNRLHEVITGRQDDKKKKIIRRPNVTELRRHYAPHLFVEMLHWIDEIDKLPEVQEKHTLRAVFSSLVVKFSNRISDSADEPTLVHFPKGAVSKWMLAKTEELLRGQQDLVKQMQKRQPPAELIMQDIQRFTALPKQSMDVIVTSPPYPGTYDYYQHHNLRLKWLNIPAEDFHKYEVGSRRRHSTKSWKQTFRDILLTLRTLTKPGGSCFLVIGDWLEGSRPVNAFRFLQQYGPSVGWEVVSSGSVQRQIFVKDHVALYGPDGKWEHLIQLVNPIKKDGTDRD